MAKNTTSARHVAPLQRVMAETITDPAEQAALDEQRRRARDGAARTPESTNAATTAETAVRVLNLSRRLSVAERSSLLARLGAELPPERQLELLARVLAQLGPEAMPPLEAELTARLGACSD